MKLVFVCFEFESNKLRKQPWRYVAELTRGLGGDVEPVVVTDTEADVDGVAVRTVDTLGSVTGPSTTLVEAVRREAPDVVATVLGPSSLFRPNTLSAAVDAPTVGVMTSPLYRLRDVAKVGTRELLGHSSYLLGHLVGALTPDAVARRHLDQYDRLVTLTRSTGDALAETGTTTPIDVVRAGLDPFDRELPPESAVEEVRAELAPDGDPIVLYFTSPLTLRGTDTLVKAFAKVVASTDATLVVLARQDGGGLSEEEQYLTELASDLGVRDSFVLLPKNLTPEGVKAHLRASDVVALPYKIVISGIPISILETMAVGRPVVTTRTDGLPELVGDRSQIVEPNDVDSLAATLEARLADADEVGRRNRERISDHPTWDEARDDFVSILEAVV
ncbi:glycosyltransferase family 4 protein [Haloarcula onubensis]|uniref:Glycosyltransferase family 4 protein n=1 Tax=Haloarcula onubensis TaxID=2950539 RepID=A0ABU2FKE8_9EURY|nr:glycosyltransferase family 4 protein [Halomicroarcula sp. S3CR25-11]MDS0280787.1 glycosyltransferase family 4 protein [Halomicroarcula sp. S3CR25-11]